MNNLLAAGIPRYQELDALLTTLPCRPHLLVSNARSVEGIVPANPLLALAVGRSPSTLPRCCCDRVSRAGLITSRSRLLESRWILKNLWRHPYGSAPLHTGTSAMTQLLGRIWRNSIPGHAAGQCPTPRYPRITVLLDHGVNAEGISAFTQT